MAWVPIQESDVAFEFSTTGSFNPGVTMTTSIVSGTGVGFSSGQWVIDGFAQPEQLRITSTQFSTNDAAAAPSYFVWGEDFEQLFNENAVDNPDFWAPTTFETGPTDYINFQFGHSEQSGSFEFLVEVWVEAPENELLFSQPALVHELDKGWSFDGNYIPHFLELNWLFMEDPVTYKTVQKIRIHGLVKGVVNLQVSLAGMQGDATTDYISDYMQPQFIDFPFAPIHISSEFLPATNYVDYSDRGLALQMKFEGRNTDITKPEPAHVIQVLALQSSPQGNGKRAN